MRRAFGRFALAWLCLGPACVNNYVVGNDSAQDAGSVGDDAPSTDASDADDPGDAGDGDSTTGSGSGVATSVGDGSGSAGDGDGDGNGDGDGSGLGDSAGDGDGGGTDGSGEACTPCVSDAQCGDASDHCIELNESQTRCARACAERPPCGNGYSCQQVVSVDGVEAEQCIPDAGSCP